MSRTRLPRKRSMLTENKNKNLTDNETEITVTKDARRREGKTNGTEGQFSKATGHRTTDAIRRAGAKRCHADENKRDGSKGNTRNRVLGEEYRHQHFLTGTVILFDGRGVSTRRTRERDVTEGIEGGGGRGNVSVTEEVNQRAGFDKVGCTLINIPLRWGPDPKQTPTTPLILNIIYFINPFCEITNGQTCSYF